MVMKQSQDVIGYLANRKCRHSRRSTPISSVKSGPEPCRGLVAHKWCRNTVLPPVGSLGSCKSMTIATSWATKEVAAGACHPSPSPFRVHAEDCAASRRRMRGLTVIDREIALDGSPDEDRRARCGPAMISCTKRSATPRTITKPVCSPSLSKSPFLLSDFGRASSRWPSARSALAEGSSMFASAFGDGSRRSASMVCRCHGRYADCTDKVISQPQLRVDMSGLRHNRARSISASR